MGIVSNAISNLFKHAWTGVDEDTMGGNWALMYGPTLGYRSYDNAAGVTMNEQIAMALPAYFACVRNISEDVAKLPKDVIRKTNKTRDVLEGHPVALLCEDPCPDMPALNFWTTWIQHAMGFLGGYAELVRDGTGRIAEMYLLDPTRTKPKRLDDGSFIYVYREEITQREIPYQPEEILHMCGPSFDGIHGYSIPAIARHALGMAMAAQQFRGAFYRNGTWLGGIIEAPGSLKPEALQNLRASWNARHGGSGNAGGTAILEEGMKYEQFGTSPEDAQGIEGLQFDVENVARYFRMPLHKIQQLLRATFANIEHQSLEYVNDTLMPWAIRAEQEMQRKLFTPADKAQGLQIKHNFNALLRGDSVARATYNKEMVFMGAKKPNEVRADEDMAPAGPEADELYIQSSMVPLTRALNPPEPIPAPQRSTPEPQRDELDDEDAAPDSVSITEQAITGYRDVIEFVAQLFLKREINQIRRVQNRPDAWKVLDAFYMAHRLNIHGALKTPLSGLCNMLAVAAGVPSPNASLIVAQYVNEHIDQSKAEIREALATDAIETMADYWLNVRPLEIADTLLEMAKGAISYVAQ